MNPSEEKPSDQIQRPLTSIRAGQHFSSKNILSKRNDDFICVCIYIQYIYRIHELLQLEQKIMKKIDNLNVNVSNKAFYYLTSNWCISKLVLILLNIFYIFRNLKQLKKL